MKNIVIIGQSHTVCMTEAAEKSEAWDKISIYYLQSKQQKMDVLELVRSMDERTSLFLSILGTYHNIIGLLKSEIEFDFLMLPQEEILEGVDLLPQRVLASVFDEHLRTERFISKIKEVTNARIYLLSAPPPKQDNDFLTKRLLNKSYRGRTVAASGLNRPELRRKLWLLECQRLEAWGKANDTHFVPAPGACFNEHGFLAERFYAQDATHANADYGLLMLELVASIANSAQNGGVDDRASI